MKPRPNDPWQRLVAAARQARAPDGMAAPYGFSTRVAALAAVPGAPSSSLVERFAWRALAAACLLAMASMAVHYQVTADSELGVDDLMVDDPLTELLDA